MNYEIEVETGSEQEQPLDAPVYLQIFGSTTTTPKLFLEPKNTAFTKDSVNKFTIPSNNVGQVRSVFRGHSVDYHHRSNADPANDRWS